MSILESPEFEVREIDPEDSHTLSKSVKKGEFRNLESSELWEDAYEMLSESDTLNESKMNKASHFVFQKLGNDVIGFASVKPNGVGPQGYGPELHHIIVDPEHRGRGYGTQVFEKQAEVAEAIAEEIDLDNLYCRLTKPPTEHYSRINNQNETSGYQDIMDIAEEEGLEPEDVFRPNPVGNILEKHGFEAYNEEIWKIDYHKDI